MNNFVLSVDADVDLDDIWDYIAAESIDSADRWIARLFDAFEALGRTSIMRHRREDLTSYSVLFWPIARTLSSTGPSGARLRLWP